MDFRKFSRSILYLNFSPTEKHIRAALWNIDLKSPALPRLFLPMVSHTSIPAAMTMSARTASENTTHDLFYIITFGFIASASPPPSCAHTSIYPCATLGECPHELYIYLVLCLTAFTNCRILMNIRHFSCYRS